MEYDYDLLCADMDALCERYGFIEAFSIGESVMGRQLTCMRVGDGSRRLFINGAHHGLEYITSSFIMRFMKDYAAALIDHTPFFGYDISRLFHRSALYAVPMVNPDGVDIAVNGIDITNPFHQQLVASVGIHSFHKVWQANARGVDINHNYDAGWRAAMQSPSPSKYAGAYPESEPETRAVVEFVRRTNIDMLIAFHSQGGEIYYDFDGCVSPHSEEIAQKLAAVSGYTVTAPTGTAAFGGCKDWFLKEFAKPGFTIEMGHGTNPLPLEMLDTIYEENARILLCALENV